MRVYMSDHIEAPIGPTASTIMPTNTGILQRACPCGQHSSNGGECELCRKKREGIIQRAAVTATPANGVPSIVQE